MNPDTQIPKNGEEVKRIPLVDPRLVDDIEFKKNAFWSMGALKRHNQFMFTK